jgi:hypothetical protein
MPDTMVKTSSIGGGARMATASRRLAERQAHARKRRERPDLNETKANTGKGKYRRRTGRAR